MAPASRPRPAGSRRLRSAATIASVILSVFASIILFGPCSKRERGKPSALGGNTIYNLNCVTSACHHSDPTKERGTVGTWGPPIAGSSLALLTLRVRSGKYPAGYTRKRNTSKMTTFPALKDDDLRSLELFLNPK